MSYPSRPAGPVRPPAAWRQLRRRRLPRWAFSYYGGLAGPQGNRFDVPRMAVESDCSLPTFRSMTRIPRYVHT